MMRCLVCPIAHVANTIFCAECGAYLLQAKELGTRRIEISQIRWLGEAGDSRLVDTDLPDTGPLTVRLRIGQGDRTRRLEVPLVKPIRLGRSDPTQAIYPEVDLTEDLGREQGVSRKHACILRKGNTIAVEDLGSTNGTLLNGNRLAPYLSEPLKDGDQLQLGMLLIEVSFVSR